MNKPIRTKTPSGEEIVIIAADAFDRLVELAEDVVDIRAAEAAIADVRAGKVELLSQADVKAILDLPNPVGFWRKRRGLTQAALAKQAGISQAYMAQVEGGRRKGDAALYQRLALALNVSIDDLLATAAERPKRKGRKPPKKTSLRSHKA